MPQIQLKQYLATIRVRLSEEVLLQHSPSSASVVGHELAEQVHEYVKKNQLGYYPALDFFEQQGGLEADLLNAAESMSWLVCRLVRNEAQTQLRNIFSNLKFQTVQTMAYTMPAVRFGSANALHDLAAHYTPLSVKLEVVLSVINKGQYADGAESFIDNALYQWLESSFDSVKVSSVLEIVA